MKFPRSTARIHSLANGLTVILDPHHDHPVVSAQLLVATGSIHEDHLLGSGLSHFLEHMVFKGTANFSGDRLASIVQAAGGHWNAYTSFDRTVYYIDGPHTGLEVFLRVLTDMVYRPTLPATEFALEKDVIRREIDMGLDDPHHASMRLLLETAFREDPRRLPVIGHRDLFDKIRHEDLVDYHQRRYTTDRSLLVISGDFAENETLALIDELTNDLQRGLACEPFINRDSPQCSMREVDQSFAVPHTKVVLAWKIPPLGHPDLPAYEMLSMMLGAGQSSHLYRELRENKELVWEIGAFTWSNPASDGLLGVSAECSPDKRDQVVAAILQEIGLYHEKDLSAALARAKRQTIVSQYRGLASASGRASDLASNWHEARDLHHTSRFLEAIDQVTEQDIIRCLNSLTHRNLTITRLNPLDCAMTLAFSERSSASPSVKQVVLSNGLEVALFPDSRLPLISMQIAIRGGLSTVRPEQSGITGLFATTLTEGTIHRNSWEIASIMEGLGASIRAIAGNNTVIVSASGLAEDRQKIMEIWSDVILHPSFPEDALQRNRNSQISSLLEALEDPLSVCLLKLRELLFGLQSYGLPSHGTEESLQKLGRDDLLAYHNDHFCAQNAKVAIAGDFAPEEIIDLLEKHLATMPAGVAIKPASTSFCEPCKNVSTLDKKQAVLAIAYPGLSAFDDRRFASMMLMEYCSDMAGPLFTRIREELGLAYQVGAFGFHGHDAGMMAFYLSTAPEQLELAYDELKQQIRNIAENGIPDETFENVRATVLSGLVLQQQSPSSTARLAAVDLLFGLPATHHREVHRAIKALQPSDIRSLAAELLREKRAVTAIVSPEQMTTMNA